MTAKRRMMLKGHTKVSPKPVTVTLRFYVADGLNYRTAMPSCTREKMTPV